MDAFELICFLSGAIMNRIFDVELSHNQIPENPVLL